MPGVARRPLRSPRSTVPTVLPARRDPRMTRTSDCADQMTRQAKDLKAGLFEVKQPDADRMANRLRMFCFVYKPVQTSLVLFDESNKPRMTSHSLQNSSIISSGLEHQVDVMRHGVEQDAHTVSAQRIGITAPCSTKQYCTRGHGAGVPRGADGHRLWACRHISQ
ncbi:hypothetical protein OH76DRAFT_430475 [Lentinus brumalis]|uniref:Uncharacterized protein n=1 Tax=Lentinus brumalis TaxID=2498619 RepID=A0A371DDI9_9APHY|nr:hypothetical protein OH76DRAFT_430475 [Polyporus brumalis]